MQRADHDRPPFSDAECIRGSIRRIRIEGSRNVHVESVTPPTDTYMFHLNTHLPDDFAPTETLNTSSVVQVPLNCFWRWADKPKHVFEKASKGLVQACMMSLSREMPSRINASEISPRTTEAAWAVA